MSDDTGVAAEWQPPAALTDPYVRRLNLDRARWARLSRGNIPEVREQAVALRLSDYGNKDGTNCHPGVQRLAFDTCTSEKTVRRALAWLTEYGWITVTHRGNRRNGEASVYRLTAPAPLAAHHGMWTTECGYQWMNRPKGEPKRPELRRETPKFPVVNSDRWSDGLEVRSDSSPVSRNGSEVNDDLPPGLLHPGLATPLRDSITASRASARRDDEDPLDDEDGQAVIDQIESTIGGPMSYDVSAMVDSMLCRGADPRMIVRVAVARERNPA